MKSDELYKNYQRSQKINLTPEFLDTSGVREYFGIKKGTLYNLAKNGKIRGSLIRATGKFSGIRLWSVASIRSYINQNTGVCD